MTLKELWRRTMERWPLGPRQYPILGKLPQGSWDTFIIRHLLARMQRSIGEMALIIERADRAQNSDEALRVNRRELRAIAARQIIDAIRLAQMTTSPSDRFLLAIQEELQKPKE